MDGMLPLDWVLRNENTGGALEAAGALLSI